MTGYSNRTGRDIFLTELLPEAHKSLQPIIIQELFEKHDRILRSRFRISEKYNRLLENGDFQVKGGTYMLQAIEVLQHFHEDVVLLSSIEHQAWDKGILKDALNLLRFQMDFLSDLGELKKICMNEGNKAKVLGVGRISNWEEAARALEEVQNALSTAALKFRNKHLILESSDEDTVSALTLRELFILNQVSKIRYISSPPTSNTAVLSKVLREVELIKVSVSHKSKVPATGNVHAWRPRTIVVVYDSNSKLFLTGATQPACDHFIFWDELTKLITRHRVGEKFAGIVDELAKSFHEQANEIKEREKDQIAALHDLYHLSAPGKDISSKENANATRIYDEIVKRETANGDKITSRLTAQPRILCVAFDGFSLEPKPPCIRCQYIYPGWGHNLKPQTPKEKIGSIHSGMNDSSVTSRPKVTGTSGPFSYCAESVAAGKLHLLRNGKLVLA